MNFTEYQVPDVGTEIEAVAIEQRTTQNWLGYSKNINPKWELELIISKKCNPTIGYIDKYKIIEITKNKIKASNIEGFGSKEISCKLRNQYLEKINYFINIEEQLKNKNKINLKELLPCITVIKTLINTPLRIKTPYRFSIKEGLNNPSKEESLEIITLLKDLKKCILDNDLENFKIKFDTLKTTKIYKYLNNFKQYLLNKKEELTVPIGMKNKSENSFNNKTKQRILSDIEKEKLRYANSEHEKTLQLLIKQLDKFGIKSEENILIDCYAVLYSGPAIFEVKSITNKNELSQIRHAVAQLYEYRYRHNLPKASLWLILSDKPKTDWVLEYLLNDRKINVLWVEYNILVGPSLEKLIKNHNTNYVIKK